MPTAAAVLFALAFGAAGVRLVRLSEEEASRWWFERDAAALEQRRNEQRARLANAAVLAACHAWRLWPSGYVTGGALAFMSLAAHASGPGLDTALLLAATGASLRALAPEEEVGVVAEFPPEPPASEGTWGLPWLVPVAALIVIAVLALVSHQREQAERRRMDDEARFRSALALTSMAIGTIGVLTSSTLVGAGTGTHRHMSGAGGTRVEAHAQVRELGEDHRAREPAPQVARYESEQVVDAAATQTLQPRQPAAPIPGPRAGTRADLGEIAQVGDAALDLFLILLGRRYGLVRGTIDELRRTRLSNHALSNGRGPAAATQVEAAVGERLWAHREELVALLESSISSELRESIERAVAAAVTADRPG